MSNVIILKCTICEKPLTGKQKKFCSHQCKSKSTNNKLQNYEAQKERSKIRKEILIKKLGGMCSLCGYDRNYASLCFHHLKDKSFSLDFRSLSNRSWKIIEREAEKCQLLCHNCHMELHYPEYNI
jgi:hypothetical protein